MKYIYRLLIVAIIIFACEDNSRDLSFVDAITAPANIAATYDISQDNTGLVTITPTADGATEFKVFLGDGTSDPVSLKVGESLQHMYAEGTYTITIEAYNIAGDKAEATQELVVSFKAPENLMVTISNNASVSKQVDIVATADFATVYEFYSGEAGVTQPVATANIGDPISYQYQNPGMYDVKVVAKGAAIQTAEYMETFEVTEILQPIASAPTPPNRNASDVISIYGSAYTNVMGTDTFPDWGQGGQGSSWTEFDLNGDTMLQYINLSYQGIQFGAAQDVSGMEFLHLDVWTKDVTVLETSLINVSGGVTTEKPVNSDLTQGDWTSIDIPISDYTAQGLTVTEILQLKFVGTPWASGTVFIDNIYFWKSPTVIPESILGTWKLANQPGALGVGPAVGDVSWFNCDATCVTARACFYDDTYIFKSDGSFENVLGSDTWIEGWQGGGDACGAPVAPHDGATPGSFVYNEAAGLLTINGVGSYLGLPKATNEGELGAGSTVPSSRTYNVTFSNNDTEMDVYIETGTGSGVFWQFKFVKEQETSPLQGTWVIANEAGALGVGPAVGDTSWWNCDATCVTDRACFYDDQYVFNGDGSFQNMLGSDTWIEGWQGGGDTCGTPVAPHDGSATANYVYDATAGTLTINGAGAYLGLPKTYNAGELGAGDTVPSSITYNVTLSNSNTQMDVYIEAGSGTFWQYKMVKQ
ncbi:hypothetical protein [Tenacibaculum sp. M341]|uniref:hypothetical protein n=1 Tax=Tenacibaculum sp. M341 TaxID=2530339 RepID=UPI00105385CD|nr:hypothetical protein [Tenacibaculum sp. M341]TCI90654.1 hypothetical protein EYW44_13090 [Tenacibaculum sp. M341]